MKVPEGGYRADKTKDELLKIRGEDLIEAIMNNYWYAKENDLIGGWCVCAIDAPPSQLGEIGNFLFKEMAEHIAGLHNEWLEKNGSSDKPKHVRFSDKSQG